jgi:hypothetical protein
MTEQLDEKDGLLRKYLCNETTESETADLEEELISDEDLDQRLHVIEMNLIDRYVRGEMSPLERASFERGFLSHAANQAKVEEAELFHRSLNRLQKEVVEVPPSIATRWWDHRVYQIPVPTLAVAALLLIVGAVVVIQVMIPKRVADSDQLTQVTVPSPTVPPQTGQQPENTSQPETRSKQQPGNTNQSEARRKLQPSVSLEKRNSNTLALKHFKNLPQDEWLVDPDKRSGLLGGDVTIKLEPNREQLRLKVPLFDNARQKTFRVVIKDADKTLKDVNVKPVPVNHNGRMISIIFVDVPVVKFRENGSFEFGIVGHRTIRFTIQR